MVKKRILPIESNPFIKSYPYYAIYLGVMEANGYDTKGIYFNHFNELTYSMYHKELNFKNRLYTQSIMNLQRFKALREDDAVDFVKKYIDEGFYICIILNGKDIAGYKRKFYHDWLIYGYDDERQILYLIGYTVFKGTNKYEAFKIKYDDLIRSLPKKKDERYLRNNFMYNHIFKVPLDYKPEDINKKQIYKSLMKQERLNNSFLKKFSVYNKFLFQLKLFHRYPFLKYFERFRCPIDKRNFRILYDYIRIRQKIFQEFCTDEELIEQHNKCVKSAELLFYLSVIYENEYDEFKKERRFQNICKQLEMMQKKEETLIKAIIAKLK